MVTSEPRMATVLPLQFSRKRGKLWAPPLLTVSVGTTPTKKAAAISTSLGASGLRFRLFASDQPGERIVTASAASATGDSLLVLPVVPFFPSSGVLGLVELIEPSALK